MFAALHADAYFSLGGEVLSYLFLWVEVIKIQIWFEFKLVWKFIKDLEKERFSNFLIEFGPKTRPNPAGPSFLLISRSPTGLPGLSSMQPVSRPSNAQRH
jgi:hypothetical protein